MNRSIFFIGLLVLGCHQVFGQQDPEARRIMDQLSQKTKEAGSLHVAFSYEYSNTQTGEGYQTEGEMWLQQDKFKLQLEEHLIYCNGETLWNYLPSVNEVNISLYEPNPDDLFTGNPLELFRIYDKDFKMRYLGEVQIGGKPYLKVDLYPLNLNKPYHRLRLIIHKQAMQIHTAELSGKQGDKYVITLQRVSYEAARAESEYAFPSSKYPGVEIIDLR